MNKKYLWLCFRLYATETMRIIPKTSFLSSPHICYEFVCEYTNDRIHAETATKNLFIVCTRAREKRTHTRIQ